MNILLIKPQFRKSENAYPLGLGYLSSALKQRGHNVFGLDLSFSSRREAISLIEKENIGLVGVYLMSYASEAGLLFCQWLKNEKALFIVAGGPYVTIRKEGLLKECGDYLDYLVIGEGERAIVELAEAMQSGSTPERIDNLIYKRNGNIFTNNCGKISTDLNLLNFPDRGIFPLFEYKGMFTRNQHYTQIISSRGCDRHCLYCPESVLWSKWRGRSIDNVISEIKEVSNNYGIKEFHFEDSNFFGGGTERIKELCVKIIESELHIIWQCPNGIPVMDFDDSVLTLMAKAGCYNICIGIETFDKNILFFMQRSADFMRIKRLINIAHNHAIEVIGYFIIGFPGQDRKSIMTDIRLSRKLRLDFIHYSIFHLIPGSSLYADHISKGEVGKFLDEKKPASKISIESLKRIRTAAYIMNFFSIRFIILACNRLAVIKNPFRFIRRAIVCLFGIDLNF